MSYKPVPLIPRPRQMPFNCFALEKVYYETTCEMYCIDPFTNASALYLSSAINSQKTPLETAHHDSCNPVRIK